MQLYITYADEGDAEVIVKLFWRYQFLSSVTACVGRMFNLLLIGNTGPLQILIYVFTIHHHTPIALDAVYKH
jgi:hypothetical protein